jgi:hypothetical protein
MQINIRQVPDREDDHTSTTPHTLSDYIYNLRLCGGPGGNTNFRRQNPDREDITLEVDTINNVKAKSPTSRTRPSLERLRRRQSRPLIASEASTHSLIIWKTRLARQCISSTSVISSSIPPHIVYMGIDDGTLCICVKFLPL